MDTTTTPTLQDFIKVQMRVDRRNRNGADSHFQSGWEERVRVFLRMFCEEQEVDLDNWEDLPGSTVIGEESLKFFEDLKSWLREQSDQFAGI